jgi:O-antigen ligase
VIYLFSIVGLLVPQDMHWILQDFLFLISLSIFISFKLYGKFHFTIGLLYLSLMVSGLFICFFTPLTHYQIYSPEVKNSACEFVALSLIGINFLAIFFLLLRPKLNNDLLKMFIALAIIDHVLMIFNHHYWIMGNHAADATFLVCILPLILYYAGDWKWNLLLTSILIQILLSKSITGISATGLLMVVFCFLKFGKRSLFATLPILLLGIILSNIFMHSYHDIGVIAGNNSLTNDNGRFKLWEVSFDYFRRNFYPYFGSGPGTFYTWGIVLQNSTHEFDNGQFFWVHNEWLQILFENGIVGLSLVISIFITALYRLRKNIYLFTSLFLFGYISLTQNPLRQPISALFIGWLTFNAFTKEDKLVFL